MIDADKLRESIGFIRREPLAPSLNLSIETLIRLCDAAEAHLVTLPQTKEIEVWHCQWVSRSGGGDHLHLNVYPTEGAARDHAEFLEAGGNKSSSALHCVQVTGPHKMMVLA